MWLSLDNSRYIEFGYKVCYDHIEKINDDLLYDNAGNQCYTVHSNGWMFSETGDTGTFTITPLDLAGMIQSHDEYSGGPIRLLSCYAGTYENGAAFEVSYYLGQPVIAAVDSVYVDNVEKCFLSLPPGLTDDDIRNMKADRDIKLTERYQDAQWVVFNG